MKLIESILTNNPCYTAGRKITVKGLMLHSVGCPQSSASVFVRNWNKASYDAACVHAFIDGDTGDVYQTLPWDHRGWHGGGSSNNTHIGVEMCEPDTIAYTGGASWKELGDGTNTKATVQRTYKAAVELFAMLCEKFGLDPLADGVIISHREGSIRGVASAHGDPEHIWTKFGLTMDKFRKDVNAAMGGTGSTSSTKTETGSTSTSQGFKVGDVVEFTGSKHYANANAAAGPACKAGKAKITAISKNGKHPYHLIAVSGSGSNVYGWVDAGDVKASGAAGTSGEPAKAAKLTVDGIWGKDTTTRLQQIFGTPVDGEVSNQLKAYKAANPGLDSGWDWQTNPSGNGSALIKAMQKWAGMAAGDQDGLVGPATIKAWQKKLGTTVDGKVSCPSAMVKALQTWANKQ